MRAHHLIAVLACLLIASVAQADMIGPVEPPVITGNIVEAPGLGTFVMTQPLSEYEYEGNGKYKLKGGFTQMVGNIEVTIEEIEFDPDPLLAVSFVATNTSSTPQTLVISFSQPGALSGSTLMTGLVAMQLIDASSPGDGATASAPTGGSVYEAQIDGITVATLLDDPYSLSAGPGQFNQGGASFGPQGGPAVTTDIGIDFSVVLSGDDIASMLGRFEVVVPEPASMALVAIGLGMVVLRRRRQA